MQKPSSSTLYTSLARALMLAAGLFILLWFLYTVLSVVLLLLFAIVLAIIINAPVTWLEKKGIRRLWGSLIVFALITLGVAVLSWLIVPKIVEQVTLLIKNLPGYLNALTTRVTSWFVGLQNGGTIAPAKPLDASQWIPSLPNTLLRIGNYSLSILGALLVVVVFISMVAYMVINPRPLLELYLTLFRPENREKAANALSRTSVMLIGWMKANLIGGGIASTCVVVFLNIIHLPGAWVWGALTFFSELVPKIGFYIMVIPPLLVALSINVMTALWLAVFLIVLAIVVDDFIMPRIRSSTMNLHPVSTLFVLLAMGVAFGFVGILIATPLAAMIKAYYEEFYVSGFGNDNKMETHIDDILFRRHK